MSADPEDFLLADIAWVFFLAETITSALDILKASFNLSNTGLILNGGLCELGLDERNLFMLLTALLVLAVYSLMKESGRNVPEWVSGQNGIFQYALYCGAVLLITFSLDITGQEFIYFQFRREDIK